jgi:uncharacterized repeat protein (TIGR01451 family)
MSQNSKPHAPRKRAWFNVWLWSLLALLGLTAQFLFWIEFNPPAIRHLPVSLQPALQADYSVSNRMALPPVSLDIVWDALADLGDIDQLAARRDKFYQSLLTPVPTVTPAVCVGSHTVLASRDTWVASASLTASNGGAETLVLGRQGHEVRQLLLYFPVEDTLPGAAAIDRAYLELHVVSAETAPPQVSLVQLAEPFSETDSNPLKLVQAAGQPLRLLSTDPQVHRWDVTQTVQAWLAGQARNAGLRLVPTADFMLTYYSREGSDQADFQFSPRLIINCDGGDAATALTGLPPGTLAPPSPTSKVVSAAVPPTTTPTLPPTVPPSLSTPTSPATQTPIPFSTPLPTPTPTVPPADSSGGGGSGHDGNDNGGGNSSPSTAAPPTVTPTFTATPTPAVVDLTLVKRALSAGVVPGGNLTYLLTVTNNGPATATDVVLSDPLPAEVNLVTVTVGQGSCGGTGTITCRLGTISVNNRAVVTLTVAVSPSATGSLTNIASVAASQIDSDPGNNSASDLTPVLPSLSIDNVTVTEGDAGTVAAVFTVSLSAASGQTVSVDYATANHTATAPADYTALPTMTLTFAPGTTTQTITVTVQSDILDEPNESFFIDLFNPANATISDGQGQGLIIDDDDPPALSITNISVIEGDPPATTTANFSVTLSTSSSFTVTVDYYTEDDTATAPDDYLALPTSTLIFPPGTLSQTIAVTVKGDLLDEPGETFRVRLTNPTQVGLATGFGTGIIIDNDLPPDLLVNDVTVTEGDSGSTSAVFTLTLSQASGKEITADYLTLDGTAVGGSDYLTGSGRITFTAGVTLQNIMVAVNGDTLDEFNETFTVRLNASTNANRPDPDGLGTIIDDDPLPLVGFSGAPYSAGEATGSVTITVQLSVVSGRPVTVTYSTGDGTATLADGDYTPAGGSLVFAPGQLTQTFTLSVTNDVKDEPNETVTVSLDSATHASGTPISTVLTITDDDGAPSLTIDDVTVTEGDAGTVDAVFTVSLSATSGQVIAVDYATGDGSAVAPGDYTAVATTTLTFNPGVLTRTISVTVQSDLLDEPTETFLVNLANPSNVTISDPQGIGTIQDDDLEANLSVTKTDSADPVTAGTTLVYTLSIANNSLLSDGQNVTVTDSMPANVTVIGTNPLTSSQSGQQLVWDLGTLASSTGQTILITVTVDSAFSGTLTNTAVVTSTTFDATPGNNTVSETTAVKTVADLLIAKTGSPDPVMAGQPLTYTLTVTNNGPSAAAGLVITDTLPAGVNFSSTSPGCTESGGAVTCTLASLVAGASTPLMITVDVDPATAGILTNTAVVTSTTADPIPINNTATETTTVIPLADLAVAKTVDLPLPSEGMTVTYVITVTNNGPHQATGVVMRDNLPGGVTYASDSGGGAYNNSTGLWTVGALANGSSRSLTLSGTVNSGSVNTTITNTASLSQTDQADPNSSNNSAQAASSVLPTLSIGDVSVLEGNSGTTAVLFTVTLSSTSPQTVTVDFTTTSGTATSSNSDFNPVSGGLSFPPGTAVQTLTVQVNGDALVEADEVFFVNLSNPINANVTADHQGAVTILNDDTDPALVSVCLNSTQDAYFHEDAPDHNHSTDKEMLVSPQVSKRARSVIKFDLAAIPPASNIITSTLFLYEENKRNNQTVFLHRLTNSWLEAQVTWDNRLAGSPWTSPGGDYSVGPEASFSPNLDNQYREIPVTGVTQGWFNATFPNHGLLLRATTSGDDGEVKFRTKEEGKPEKRPQLCVTYSLPQADLALTKTVDKALPHEAELVAFTLTVANGGPKPATGIVIRDRLPAGLTYVANLPSQGVYTAASGAWNVGSLTLSANASLIITATVNGGTAGTLITNTAAISRADQLDLITANNLAVAIVSPLPSVSVNDVSVTEGDAGTVNAVFTVGLSAASGQTVSVDYATANNTAITPADYTALPTATLTFAPGVITRTITVTVRGDLLDELDESFFVNLSNSSNATIGDGQGQGTIIDNDPPPDLLINDVTITEGDSGSVSAVFTVTLSQASGRQVTADYLTLDGSATVGSDYLTGSGRITFTAGVTVQNISITVNGDTLDELHETFTVRLNASTNANRPDPDGLGTILDDDNLLISEVFYDTPGVDLDEEWIELYNPTSATVDLASYKLGDEETSGGSEGMYQFPAGATINPGQRIIVALTTSGFFNLYGFKPDYEVTGTDPAIPNLTPYASWATGTFNFNNNGDELLLLDSTDTPVDVVTFETGSHPGCIAHPGALGGNSIYRSPLDQDTNNCSVDFITRAYADLAVIKTVNNPTPSVGSTITFTVSVRNDGPEDGSRIVVSDTLPPGLSLLTANPSRGSYIGGTGLWTIGPITNSQSVTLTLAARVTSTGVLTNTAQLMAAFPLDSDSDPGNGVEAEDDQDSQVVTPTLSGTADLSISKSESSDPIASGQPLTYTLLIKNDGPITATGVVVTDLLPPGVTFGSVTASQGSCAEAAGTVTCNLGTLGPINTPLVQSNFNTNPDGWRTTHDAVGNPNPVYAAIGGNPDGFISAVDGYAGVTFYYGAPAKFLGNKSAAYRGSLAFDIRRSNHTPDPPDADVRLIGAGLTLRASIATPNTSWTSYSIPLKESSWINTATGLPPTQLDMVTVLSSITTLQIRGEYSSDAGDGSGLDNVVLNRGPARITVVVTPTLPGSLNNTAGVAGSQPDPVLSNNTATVSTLVTGPGLSINDVAVDEGDSGTTTAIFTVTLSAASAVTVNVNYATADNTATLADNDYLATSGTLVFPPGITNRPITVTVYGDTKVEGDETFLVNLSSPVNAAISDGQGLGLIRQDVTGFSVPLSPTDPRPIYLPVILR